MAAIDHKSAASVGAIGIDAKVPGALGIFAVAIADHVGDGPLSVCGHHGLAGSGGRRRSCRGKKRGEEDLRDLHVGDYEGVMVGWRTMVYVV